MHRVVVGTGSMAPEIAAALAAAGGPVVIAGRSLERAEDAARRATALGDVAEPITALPLEAADVRARPRSWWRPSPRTSP